MNEKETLDFARGAFKKFQRGEIESLLGLFSDDIEIHSIGPKGIIPFAGIYKGIEKAAKFFKIIAETQEFKQFEPKDFIAHGDKILVIGYEQTYVKTTKKNFELDWAIVARINENKIISIYIFADTMEKTNAFMF